MAVDKFEYKDSGPGEHANYLKSLRQALDSGQITVDEYVQKGMPVAQEAYQKAAELGSGGSGSASTANQIRGVLKQSGFSNKGTADNPFNVMIDLPDSYQEQVRNSLLPPGLSDEQKQAYLKDIPQDIQIGSDQYNLEKEGIRQRLQQETTLGQQKSARATMLDRLGSVLNTNADNQFKRSIAGIADNANTAGIFRSTGYGHALAEKQGQLQEDVSTALGKASIDSENADINTMADIESNAQGFQTAGLSRKMSLDDFVRNKDYALDLANASKPATPGKTNGEKWAQGINTGSKVVEATGSAKNPGPKKG